MAINPLQQPINYSAQMVDLTKNFQGLGDSLLSLGEGFAEQRKAEEAAKLRSQYATDLQAALDNPSQKTWSEMIAKYPQHLDAFESVRKNLGDQQIENQFNQGFTLSMALENQDVDTAINLLDELITAKQNSNLPFTAEEQVLTALQDGNIKGAQAGVNYMLAMADPERFEKAVKAREAAVISPSKIKEAESKAEVERINAAFAERLKLAGLDESKWQVKNLQSQINDRASKLKLDTAVAQATVAEKMSGLQNQLTNIPESAQKLVNESVTQAVTARQSADQLNSLAKQIDSFGGSWGAFNSLGEWTKATFGAQDLRSSLQNEYTRLANSAGIKAYKASGASGAMSDADLNVALSGIPKSDANPKEISRFLRGMAKMQEIDAELSNAKTDWLTNNRGQLSRSTKGFTAGNYQVSPGESYVDFASKVATDVSNRYAGIKPKLPATGAGAGRGSARPTEPAGIVVTLPNGTAVRFNNQADADAFKTKAGIR